MQIELISQHCLPRYAHPKDAAMDCVARTDCDWILEGGMQVAYVPLGFKIAVPNGHVLKLHSRSGHGWKHNITLANSVGLIDPNFRGEVQAKLIRQGISITSPEPIKMGDRVAQMTLEEVNKIYLDMVDSLSSTDRGSGFGSSGV